MISCTLEYESCLILYLYFNLKPLPLSMSSSSRLGTRISSRVNKLAGRKVADRDSIQQICDQPATRKLMTWLDTVLQDEALTEGELETYEEMCASEIDDLFAEDDVKLPELRNDKSALEEEIAHLEQELLDCEAMESAYSKQKNILSEQNKRIKETTSSCSFRLDNDDSISAEAVSKVLHHRFEKQLESLETVINDHIKLHEHDKDAALFLTSVPFDEYIESELEFTKALGKYSEKLFFPGISRVPGDPKDCPLVGLDDEDKENSRHSLVGAYKNVKDTIKRTKATYAVRQEEAIAETVNVSAYEVKIKALKALISDVTNEKFPHDEETLNRMAQEYSIASIRKEDEIKMTWKTKALPLIEQLKNLQDVHILCGDYKMKLARQNYFMSRQDKVIDNLISQLSRQELLQVMLKCEYKVHVKSLDLLQDILAHVSLLGKTIAQQTRLTDGENAILPVRSEKLCLGSNDKTLNCLVDMLKTYLKQDSHNIFHTFEELTNALNAAIAESTAAEEVSNVAVTQVLDLVASLDQNLSRCSTCLEKGFTSTTHEEDRLASAINELEHLATSLRDEFQDKSASIKNSDKVSIARQLFVYFFTDPEKLNELLHGDF